MEGGGRGLKERHVTRVIFGRRFRTSLSQCRFNAHVGLGDFPQNDSVHIMTCHEKRECNYVLRWLCPDGGVGGIQSAGMESNGASSLRLYSVLYHFVRVLSFFLS